MAKKKYPRLTPIPFEAQQAQSEWLLSRFDQGLSCVENPTSHIPGYVEGGVAPRLTVPRSSRIQPQSFRFNYVNERHWIYALRNGDIEPSAPITHAVITVVPHYQVELNRWLFIAYYEGERFTVSLADEFMDRHEYYENVVARKLIEQFKVYDNEQT